MKVVFHFCYDGGISCCSTGQITGIPPRDHWLYPNQTDFGSCSDFEVEIGAELTVGTPTLEVEHVGDDDWMSETVKVFMEAGRAEFVLSQFRHKNSRTSMNFTGAWPA